MTRVRAGLTGKLPAHGDFVRRGAPAVVAFLDDWLADELARFAPEERAALLERLQPRMFVAVGTSVGDLAGVLCASHDRVGRLYPLVVFVEGDDAAELTAWAWAIGRLLDTIAPDVTADALFAAIGAILPSPPSDPPPPVAGSLWWRDGDGCDPLAFPAMPTATELATMLAGEPA